MTNSNFLFKYCKNYLQNVLYWWEWTIVWGRISSYGDVGMRIIKWFGVFLLGFSRFIFEKYT